KYRELRSYAADLGEQVRECDPPNLFGDAVREKVLEPRLGAGTGDLELRERGHVEQADLLVHVPAFSADVLEIVGAAEAPLFPRTLAGRHRRVIIVQQHVRLGELGVAEPISRGREPV